MLYTLDHAVMDLTGVSDPNSYSPIDETIPESTDDYVSNDGSSLEPSPPPPPSTFNSRDPNDLLDMLFLKSNQSGGKLCMLLYGACFAVGIWKLFHDKLRLSHLRKPMEKTWDDVTQEKNY
uniref:Uncharacterized protein n=1 Tax=Lactuca sativa TaxID=4236 RepID=A0A9R1VSF1_LACSA|nr:hypothetical protein LSAT_V11C400196670 [Lactuca sativa]